MNALLVEIYNMFKLAWISTNTRLWLWWVPYSKKIERHWEKTMWWNMTNTLIMFAWRSTLRNLITFIRLRIFIYSQQITALRKNSWQQRRFDFFSN